MKIDIRDGVASVGLALVASGLWWVYEPSALIVVGSFLVFVAVKGGRA